MKDERSEISGFHDMKIKENSTTELSYLKCLQKLFDNCP
jgi:hypothetical protein